MAVRTQQREVLDAIITPITIDVLDFDWNFAGDRMSLAPAAFAATLTEAMDQILLYEAVAVVDTAILAAFHEIAALQELASAMTPLRAKSLLGKSNGFAAYRARARFAETGTRVGAPQGAVLRSTTFQFAAASGAVSPAFFEPALSACRRAVLGF